MRIVDVPELPGLTEHAAVAHLTAAVAALRDAAHGAAPALHGRTLWMVNSTEHGGGVAEMLPGMVSLLRELGIATRWAVIEADEPGFFAFTKRVHNLIHDAGDPAIGPDDVALYEQVNRRNAEALLPHLRPGDIVALHDPQPLPMAPLLRAAQDVHVLWRCHIGLDERTPRTQAAWQLLQPYALSCERVIFSAADYVPPALASRSVIIHPAIDPLAPKNTDLNLHAVVCLLASAGLSLVGPTVPPPFEQPALRVTPDGRAVAARELGEIGLLTRPIVMQVSRWDRLKGFLPLMQAFAALKARPATGDEHARRRAELLRLVLAGPVVGSVSDDPESREVLDELIRAYVALPPAVQKDIVLLQLPMSSREENALIVNALQRAATIVAQNSLREGFGLTIAEAMWKRVPVLTSAQAAGPRTQVTDEEHGRLVHDPQDPAEIADTLADMLHRPHDRARWARNAQRRAHDEFMIFTQLRRWVDVCREVVEDAAREARGSAAAADG